jgi:hypothetical protein
LGIHLEIDKYDKYNINQKLTEPTKWISNTTTVKKPNKFRIRIDRTDKLKALKRLHYTKSFLIWTTSVHLVNRFDRNKWTLFHVSYLNSNLRVSLFYDIRLTLPVLCVQSYIWIVFYSVVDHILINFCENPCRLQVDLVSILQMLSIWGKIS